MHKFNNPLELLRSELVPSLNPIEVGPETDKDEDILIGLQREAKACGFLGQNYLIKSERGLVIPANLPRILKGHIVSIIEIPSIKVCGEFKEFRKLSLDGLGSWCLNFEQPMLLPDKDKISDRLDLLIPGVSVTEINQSSP